MSRRVVARVCICLTVGATYGAVAPSAGAADLANPVDSATSTVVTDVEPVVTPAPVEPEAAPTGPAMPAPAVASAPAPQVASAPQPDEAMAVPETTPPAGVQPSAAAADPAPSIQQTLEGVNPELAASAPANPPVAGPRLALAAPHGPNTLEGGLNLDDRPGPVLPVTPNGSGVSGLSDFPQVRAESNPVPQTDLGPLAAGPQATSGFLPTSGLPAQNAAFTPAPAISPPNTTPATLPLDSSPPNIAGNPATLLDPSWSALDISIAPSSSASASDTIAFAGPGSPHSPDLGLGLGGSSGLDGPASGGTFFFGFAAMLLGLLVLAGQALSRRLRSALASWQPVPFVSLLERPG